MRNLYLIALLLMGCPASENPGDMTMAMDLTAGGPDMSVPTACGRPGDVGNAKGVGKYCKDSGDCTGQMASICSSIMNTGGPMDTYFCTFQCDPMMAGQCGPNAVCAGKDFGGTTLYGCVPAPCAPTPQG
jgi:hypothetical protein